MHDVLTEFGSFLKKCSAEKHPSFHVSDLVGSFLILHQIQTGLITIHSNTALFVGFSFFRIE